MYYVSITSAKVLLVPKATTLPVGLRNFSEFKSPLQRGATRLVTERQWMNQFSSPSDSEVAQDLVRLTTELKGRLHIAF